MKTSADTIRDIKVITKKNNTLLEIRSMVFNDFCCEE